MAAKYFEETPKLGFGLMRLPRIENTNDIDIEQCKEMVDLFLDAGLTYFDTAYVYEGSEEAARKSLVERHPRESYTLTSKINAGVASSAEDCKQQLTTSLERTGAGYFDYYLLHALGKGNIKKYDEWGIWDFVKEAKDKGLVKHYGFSFHDSPEFLDELLTKHPDVELVQLQINYADWENNSVQSRACYEVARKHDKLVVVMEPVKGGMLANPPQRVQDILKAENAEVSMASWAIRFVASQEGILTVLSGMSNVAQVQDNISYMGNFQPFTEKEQETIVRAQAALADVESIACTACHYCTAGCPMNIAIPDVFKAMNDILIWDNEEGGKRKYAHATGNGATAGSCIKCGQCEGQCPQHLPIRDLLDQCSAKFD